MPPLGPGRRRVIGRRARGVTISLWESWMILSRIGRFNQERLVLMRRARLGDPEAIRTLWERWQCRWVKS